MRHPQLRHESIIYDVLAGGPGIPQCHWHGHHDNFDCIIIDLLGPNLNQLKEVVHEFPLEVVVDFGCQMISIVEHIHKRGLIYRDIKPDNFLFSSKCYLPEPEMVEMPDDHGMPHIKYVYPKCQEVFAKWGELKPKLHIVDFGLTTWWRDPDTDKPYPEAKKTIKNKTGTARYASLNVHRGKTHSRRDDIESIGYLLLDLMFGTLPWTGIQARNSRMGWDRMRQIKQDTFLDDLCAGLPQGFLKFIEYSRRLKFAEEPNYDLLRRFLSGSIHDGKYAEVVKSPFGGHTERKWVQDIEKETFPVTRAEMGRPNSKVNPLGKHYYELAPFQNITSAPAAQEQVPRQRRASHQPFSRPKHQFAQQQQQNNDDADVFAMDDLTNNLPDDVGSKISQRTSQFNRGTYNNNNTNNNSNNNNNNNGYRLNKRPSRDFGKSIGVNINSKNNNMNNNNNNINHTATDETLVGPSSFQKLLARNRKRHRRIGWNSHKHDEVPWQPATDWERPDNPDINITYASWGEDDPNAGWGEDTSKNARDAWGKEEEGTWAATVTKPWE
ncbi:kinase-like domain-containing protein [Mycotypha africana]|uniref:kinase-like domain-containing protein n=1 Tax=Mycotypha africana TaxID=64632 RepID=UPI002300D652|nr:kinase-like domain-containing protein [Mycotypha africana]KAI8970016.1 kinase-like domain-containing protein [Mycotypha africana]